MKRILCFLAAVLLAGAVARGQGACVPPSIVSQPENLAVAGCCPCAIFNVAAAGTAPLFYQWERNGMAIPGANSASYTNCNVTPADNGAMYRVLVTNACGQVYSASATLTLVQDVHPPRLLSASAQCESNKVTLTFDECMDPASAGDPANYVIDGGALTILSVTLPADPKIVCLFVDTPFASQSMHTVSVSGVLDQCGNQLDTATLPIQIECKDCLELSNESLECVPGSPGRYTWKFTLQNLSTNSVKYVFLAPVTNCFTVTPAVIALAAPLAPGQSIPLMATLEISTNCGSHLCLYVATHDAEFALCCSELHCLDLKRLLPPAKLEIRHVRPNIVITWNGCGVLQCTTTLGAPWMDVPGATSPYITPASGMKKFYRLRY